MLVEYMYEKDVIIYLVVIVGYFVCDKDLDFVIDINVVGIKNIIEFKIFDQKLIYVSMGLCYGVVDGVCMEEIQISFFMFYGSSKVDVEKMVLVVNGVGFCLVIVFGFFF